MKWKEQFMCGDENRYENVYDTGVVMAGVVSVLLFWIGYVVILWVRTPTVP